MKISLLGKTALVCGGSKGIGKGIAIQFAESGANCIMFARNEEHLADTIKSLDVSQGQKHFYFLADSANHSLIIAEIEKLLNNGFNISILVNNTGGPKPGPIIDADDSEFIQAFQQHIVLSQFLVKLLVPNMKAHKFGRIINVISIGAKQPVDNLGVSNTIRGAMMSWSKTLSKELAPDGITVNNLLPGQTWTARLESLITNIAQRQNKSIEQVKNEMIADIPVGRLGDIKDFGYAATFLASQQAEFITGTSLPIDGGYLRCF